MFDFRRFSTLLVRWGTIFHNGCLSSETSSNLSNFLFENIANNDLSMIWATSKRFIYKIVSYGLRNLKFYACTLFSGFYQESQHAYCTALAKSAFMKLEFGSNMYLILRKTYRKEESLHLWHILRYLKFHVHVLVLGSFY